MKKLVIILIILNSNMFGLFGQSNKKLTFTKEYFAVLEQEVGELELISLKELEIRTKFNENEHTHFLDNAYNEYEGDEKSKKEVIGRYVKSAIELYKPKPTFSIDQVVPVIKHQRYIDEILRLTGKNEVSTLYEKYNSELYIFYARDLENSISYISKEDAENYNIELKGLKELAIENLMNRISNIERQGENGYYMLTAGGDYEASLILESSIWTDENFDVEGEIIIGIPSRDVLLITGSQNIEGVQKLVTSIKEITNSGSYVISEKMYILKNGEFEIWKN